MYTACFAGVAVSAAQDLFEINAPADSAVILHRVVITQSSDTDSEQLIFSIQRAGTSGADGSTATPAPLNAGDAAFGGTVEINNTTRAGTLTLLHRESQNVLNGWDWCPTPECRVVISPSGRVIIGLEAAPADALTMGGTAYFEEIGG